VDDKFAYGLAARRFVKLTMFATRSNRTRCSGPEACSAFLCRKNSRRILTTRQRSRGTASIEFALLFIPFFAMFYAIVSYGIVMLLAESFTAAAQDGARAALAIDPSSFADTTTYIDSGVVPKVRDRVAANLSWLPTTVKDRVLGAGNQNVGVDVTNGTLTVTVQYADYRTSPLMPILSLPGIGPVPNVPQNLSAIAKIQL